MDLQKIETISKIVASIATVVTFVWALWLYLRQRKDKRAEQFLELRNYFRDNERFQNILEHLCGDNDFTSISLNAKFEFMSFFEDVAFLMNSKLIKEEVVFYMFGGDAIIAWNNDKFWSQELRDNKLWSLLTDFVHQMEEKEKEFRYKRGKIKL